MNIFIMHILCLFCCIMFSSVLLWSTVIYAILLVFYCDTSIMFYSIPFHSIVLCSILFHSVGFCCVISYSIPFIVFYFIMLYSIVGRDTPVGVATRYRLDGPGIESRWGRDFPHLPDRPWGPPSLLYNGYRVFPGSKAAGTWR